jgi:hypothetical protein
MGEILTFGCRSILNAVWEVGCLWNFWKNLSFLGEFWIAVDFGG